MKFGMLLLSANGLNRSKEFYNMVANVIQSFKNNNLMYPSHFFYLIEIQ